MVLSGQNGKCRDCEMLLLCHIAVFFPKPTTSRSSSLALFVLLFLCYFLFSILPPSPHFFLSLFYLFIFLCASVVKLFSLIGLYFLRSAINAVASSISLILSI